MDTLKKDELLVLSYTSLSKCDTGAENYVTLQGLSEDYSISYEIEKEMKKASPKHSTNEFIIIYSPSLRVPCTLNWCANARYVQITICPIPGHVRYR